MSIQGLGGIYGQQGIIPGTRQLGGGEEVESGASRATQEGPKEATGILGAAQELPVKAPPGTDPNLWSVLTAEERSFFARMQTMGPLTYDRSTGNSAEAAMQRGSRIDVRV
jgi:hypothetical protein